MSAILWARTVRCDFPGCENEATVELSEQWPSRQMPEGWVELNPRLNLADLNGERLAEFCPVHSLASLSDLLAAVTP